METQSVAEPKINFDNSFSRSMEGLRTLRGSKSLGAKAYPFQSYPRKRIGVKGHRF